VQQLRTFSYLYDYAPLVFILTFGLCYNHALILNFHSQLH